MSQKVGSGYVEIEPRVTVKDLRELQKKIKYYLDQTKVYIKVDVRNNQLAVLRKKISDYLTLRPVYMKVDVRQSDLLILRRKISDFLSLRPVYIDIDVRNRSIAAMRAKIQAGLAGVNVGVNGGRGGGGGGRGGGGGNVPRPPGNRGGGGRNNSGRNARRLFGFGSAAGNGFLAGIANAFQLNGPVGGAVILTLAAAIAAAAVPLGAMLGGLIFAAMGTAPLIGAVLVGLEDPRVGKAFTDLKNKFYSTVVEPLKGDFGGTIVNILKQFSDGLDRWAPLLQSILKAGMSFAQPIANDAVDAIDIFLPGFDQLVNSKFMKRIMAQLGEGLKIIATAFTDAFGDILNDPVAQEGFVRGLGDFFEAAGWIIRKAFDFLRFLARTWESWNTKDENGISTVDRFKKLFTTLNDIWKILTNIIFTKENLDAALEIIEAAFAFVRGVLNIIDKALSWIGDPGGFGDNLPDPATSRAAFFEGFSLAFNVQIAKIKQSWENFKTWWGTAWDWFTAPFVTAWQNAKAEWDRGWAYLSGGWDNFKEDIQREWNEFWDPFAVAWDKIKQGWSDLMEDLKGIWSGFLDWLSGNAVDAAIKGLPTKSSGKGSKGGKGKRFGGLVHAATGGLLMGAGSGISDSIPLMASNGEFVVNAKATSDNLGMLNAINNGATYQPNINVYIDGVKTAHRAVVDEAFEEFTSSLIAGRGAS